MKVPQGDLFRACSHVLDRELVPLHYRDLTRMALEYIGKSDDLTKRAEDVREKLPVDRRFGVFYTQRPLCYMAKRRWFPSSQLDLLNVTAKTNPIRIEGSVSSGIEGAYVTLMRNPHMMAKVDLRTRCRGLVIEQHVADWFQRTYPEFYLPPSNENLWEVPAADDFRLSIPGGGIIHVDVASPNRNGEYRLNKRTTMLHLYAAIADNRRDVILVGTKLGDKWTGTILPEHTNNPQRLIVWLNCLKRGVPIDELKCVAVRETVPGWTPAQGCKSPARF